MTECKELQPSCAKGKTVGLLKSVFQETFGTILKHLFGQCGT